MTKNIKSLKLINGEEILSEIISKDSEYVELKLPATMSNHPDGDVFLIPWLFSMDLTQTIKLEVEKIFIQADTSEVFLKAYADFKKSASRVPDYANDDDLLSLDAMFDDIDVDEDYDEDDEDDEPTMH